MRETIKSLTKEAHELGLEDYLAVLERDVINGNYSQLNKRLGSMSKRDLLYVLDGVFWATNNYPNDSEQLKRVHKYAVNALTDKLTK